MKQLTLRQIPQPVEQALRRRARRTGTSLNKAAIATLAGGLGLEQGPRKKRDLSRLAGRWTAEEAEQFAETLAVFEEIDEEVWR